MSQARFIVGDSLSVLRTLPDSSVDLSAHGACENHDYFPHLARVALYALAAELRR